MSSFNQRTKTSNELIGLLSNYYWNTSEIKDMNQIVHFEYGYETHIDYSVQNKLRLRQSRTAKHIRFAPDFLVFRTDKENSDFLLEYKVTKTPRYKFGNKQWNYGQIEADALENYLNLLSMGICVAVVIYCPYHSRPLLCGIPDRTWIYGGRQSTFSSSGSGTDYYNIDLSVIPEFSSFMKSYLGIPLDTTDNLLNKGFFNLLKNNPLLGTTHARSSTYNNPRYSTGFNWTGK
ncbi:MAG: hypothetical protein GX300_07350 [Tissierellia bacterium]|nr:hypothetical protein [Tissierellia bacterium]